METADKPIDILVVGQTPPPYHGQAVMIQAFLDGPYEKLRMHHLRMSYSDHMTQVGRLSSRKILHLFELIFQTYVRRLRIGRCYLFYPPAGPNLFPLVRDVVYLLCTRWLFSGTIFRYDAAGVSERVATLPAPLRLLAHLAYGKATCSVRLSSYNPDDASAFRSRHSYVIPNAVPDHAAKLYGPSLEKFQKTPGSKPRVLFVGVLNESKGTLVLLDALAILLTQGFDLKADIVGEIESPIIRRKVEQRLKDPRLRNCVTLHGPLAGEAKWKIFREADVLAFPTFFESESFGLVAIEAMQFKIPVVATQWRGVQSVVVDGETGFLTPIRNPAATADAIARLLRDPERASRMGAAGRERYIAEYTMETFWKRMEQAIVESTCSSRQEVPGIGANLNTRWKR
jgi:glycosyltransferase involved in cell wall biosynthesis